LKEILWVLERVVAARSTKDTDRFRWKNSPFLVDRISNPPPNTPNWIIFQTYFGRDTENNENYPISELNSDDETTADSDYELIAGPSTNLPQKKYVTRNRGKK
ncbi:6233_t:CDS:1, partial [Dentiscutata erythropus]